MQSKKEIVYDQLRSQIIDCTLKPGSPINEADFASRFGVSKTPIREAIRQLEREGLVDSIPGRGSIISFISSGDIYETFEIREILECGASRRAAMLKNKDKIIEKRNKLLEIKQKLNGDESNTNGLDSCNDLHLEIIDSVGNNRLSQMYREIIDTIDRIRNNFGNRFTERRLENINDEHIAILNAIIDGDSESAQRMVQEHLRNASSYVSSLT